MARQILDPMALLQLPSREPKLPHVFPCEEIKPHSTVPPTRPTRSDRVDPDLIAREIPVIVSSLADQSIRKRNHRRGWTNHRAKNKNSPDHSPANSDMFRSGQQTLAISENPASYSRNIDSKHSVDEELRDYPTASSSTHSLQSCYHTNVDSTQLPLAYPINHDNKEDLDIQDLTTPTLKSCERFEDDNSITPCQTLITPNLKKGIQITPRMIYEEYQRKFNQEEIIIKSNKSKISPSRPSTRPTINNGNHGSLPKANNVMSSATALDESYLSDTSLEDSSDESFESFGDDQFFGPPLSSKLPKSTRERISPLLSTFPLPPAARRSCPSTNFQRTPSPKQLTSHDSKILTPENMVPRFLIDCDKRDPVKSRTSSPLVLGKPLSVPGSSSPKKQQLPSRPAIFQLQPSPYRHVEHASIVHDGPNHLESSTRLMQMFESFLESSPKGNNSLGASPRSALSRKSTRKFKLEESPLKKMRSLQHLSETPPQPNMQHKLSGKRDTFGRHSHPTSATMISNSRPSGLAFEISKPNLDTTCSTGVDFTSFGASPPDSGSLLSSPPSADGSLKNFPTSLRDEHPSPASDSDDEPSPSPKTPFGNFFIPPNHLEPYVPTFEPNLSRESFYQKLDSHTSLKSQTHSLEVVEDHGLIQRFPKMAHSTKTNETSFQVSKEDETATTHASRQPQLKHKRSAVSLIADGIRSRFTTQRGPRDSLHYGESDGRANPIGPTDEGFDTSPENSTWKSIHERDFYHQSRSNVAQIASATKLISGRILFEESSRRGDLIENRQTTRRNDPAYLSLDYSLNQLINPPHNRSGLEISQHTWGSSLTHSSYTCESEQEIIADTGSEPSEESGPHDVQQILSPIRLYGKQQGVLETGNWKTNNLNFRSMKSQYQLKSHVSENRIGGGLDVGSMTSGGSRRDRTMTEQTQTQRGSSCSRSLEEEEAAEREQKESLMVYKIQEEDENQILSFEFNRLKRIFHNKALKSSKSKSKLSSKPLANFFNH